MEGHAGRYAYRNKKVRYQKRPLRAEEQRVPWRTNKDSENKSGRLRSQPVEEVCVCVCDQPQPASLASAPAVHVEDVVMVVGVGRHRASIRDPAVLENKV